MIKTRIVLHDTNDKLPVVNLQSRVYVSLCRHRDVGIVRRGEESYFHVRSTSLDEVERNQPFRASEAEPSLREISNAFFAIKTPNDAKEFLASYGPLGSLWDFAKWWDWSASYKVRWSELIKTQDILKEAWRRPHTAWDSNAKEPWSRENTNWSLARLRTGMDLPFHVNFDLERPVLYAVVATGVQALVADLFLTTLAGLSSGFCARPDCGKLFQKTTKHERKFCSQDCAHMESVRKFRARLSTSR